MHRGTQSEVPNVSQWLVFVIGIILIGIFVYYLADILKWIGEMGTRLYYVLYHAVSQHFR